MKIVLFFAAALLCTRSVSGQEFYLLEGALGGRYPVKMLLCRNENTLTGSYYYRSSGQMIALEGYMRSETDADFFEFAEGEAESTGQFYGTLTASGFEGHWLNLNTRKELTALLSPSPESDEEFWRSQVYIQFDQQPGRLTDFFLPRIIWDGNHAVEKTLREAFSFERLSGGETWAEIERKYATEEYPTGMISMSGAVTCNRDYVFSAIMSLGGMGAYPTYWDERINIHLRKARLLQIDDCLDMETVGPLVEFCRATIDDRIQADLESMRENGVDPYDIIGREVFTVDDLTNFSIIDGTGVAFCAKWTFPRYALALEPDRVVVIPFYDILPYLRVDSPLEALCH